MYTFNKYNNPILLWYGEGVEYENDEEKVQNNVQICRCISNNMWLLSNVKISIYIFVFIYNIA